MSLQEFSFAADEMDERSMWTRHNPHIGACIRSSLQPGGPVFKESRQELQFKWKMLGNLAEGRPNLGLTTDVSVYRLMQFTLRDVLIRDFGVEATTRVFFDAGKSAGIQFCENLIDKNLSFPDFISALQGVLSQLRVGILRVEKADVENLEFTITVAEDLDCSGLPVSDEEICTYDEGFIGGILQAYTGREFSVTEVDCWCSGDRVCRFEAKLK